MNKELIKDLEILKMDNSFYNAVFTSKYSDLKELTTNEIKDLISLSATALKYNKGDYLTLHMSDFSNITSIFKLSDDCWVTWDTDERNYISNTCIFNNSKDACNNVINEFRLNKDFFDAVRHYITEEDIERFINDFNFTRIEDRSLII